MPRITHTALARASNLGAPASSPAARTASIIRSSGSRASEGAEARCSSCAWPTLTGACGGASTHSAGLWLAGGNRQLSLERPLVRGPSFAAGDIGGEVRVLVQDP